MDENKVCYKEYCEYRENFKYSLYFKGIWHVIFRIVTFPIRLLYRLLWVNSLYFLIRHYIPSIFLMINAVCQGMHPRDLLKFDHEMVAYDCMILYMNTFYAVHVFLCDITYLFMPKSYLFFTRNCANQYYRLYLNSIQDHMTEVEKMNDLTPIKKDRILRSFDRVTNRCLTKMCHNLLIPKIIEKKNGFCVK